MSKKTTQTINFTLAADKPLSAEERAQLAQLAAMPDEDIDFSDIPRSSPNTKWTRPGLMMTSENKQQVTLRLDREVLDFFRSSGRRYQTKINAVLRAFVESQSHR